MNRKMKENKPTSIYLADRLEPISLTEAITRILSGESLYSFFKNSEGMLVIDLLTQENIYYAEDNLQFKISDGENNMVGYTMIYDEYESGGISSNTHKGKWRFCHLLADDYLTRIGKYGSSASCLGYHRHHKDGNKLNNNPSNIERLSNSEHAKIHVDNLDSYHTPEHIRQSRAKLNFTRNLSVAKQIYDEYGELSKNLYDSLKYLHSKRPIKWEKLLAKCGTYDNMIKMLDNYEEVANSFSNVKSLGKVYLAGGWFDDEQMERLEAVKSIILEAGYEVFSPKDENLCDPNSDMDWKKQVFQNNLTAIRDCSFVVNITDKKDMGTIFEAGLAYALGRPIVYFAETLGNNQFNLMLAQSGVAVAQSRDQLKSLLSNPTLAECLITGDTYADYEGEIE